MAALDYPHIHKVADEAARLERLPRVRVAQIVADHLGYGWSAEEIVRQHSHLLPAEVHAALAYYFDHPAEIDTELAAELDEMDLTAARSASPLRQRLLTIRRNSAA
jgi:hypothetical protein